MAIVEYRGGRLTPDKLCKKFSKQDLAHEYLRLLDEYERLAARHERLLDEKGDDVPLRIGFASFRGGGVELIVRDEETKREVTVAVGQGPGTRVAEERLRVLGHVLPQCVFVKARHLLKPLDGDGLFPDGEPVWQDIGSVPDDTSEHRVTAHLFDGNKVHRDCVRDIVKGEWWSPVDLGDRVYRVLNPTHWFPALRLPRPPRESK